jgi:hypothetical protein
MLKSFAHYLLESETLTYDFKVKIACHELDDKTLDNIEHALNAFQVVSISKPKHMPIVANNPDFPSFGACDVNLINVSLKYPCTDEQVRHSLSLQGRIPIANIVVIPKNQPEEILRDDECECDVINKDESPEQRMKKAILTKELEKVEGGQELVGSKRAESMLKDLEKGRSKIEFAAKTEGAPKTTNDLPQNNTSPVLGRKGMR